MSLNNWSGAFLLTQLIELPIYLAFARSLPLPKRCVYAFGASTITHPLIWFCLPWTGVSYWTLVFIAEAFAVVVEALWGRGWRVQRAWTASLVANALSAGAGLLVRDVLMWKITP